MLTTTIGSDVVFTPVMARSAVGDPYVAFTEVRQIARDRVLLRLAAVLAGIAPFVIVGSLLVR